MLKEQEAKEEKEKLKLPVLKENDNKKNPALDEKFQLRGLVHEKEEFKNKKYYDEYRNLSKDKDNSFRPNDSKKFGYNNFNKGFRKNNNNYWKKPKY